MSQSIVILVSDDQETVTKTRQYCEGQGVTVQSYSSAQWRDGLESTHFRQNLVNGVPALAGGVTYGGNVVPFPGVNNEVRTRVSTMDELESQAISTAIMQYKGNLTEAAKALGIGRATLYRKVKQYNIDPTAARKKRAA